MYVLSGCENFVYGFDFVELVECEIVYFFILNEIV